MRRNALFVSAALVMIATLSGCSLWKKSEPVSANYPEMDWYSNPAQGSSNQAESFQSNSNPVYGAPVETQQPMERAASTVLMASAPRYHTVMKKDTLYSLARQYYGEAGKWKEIYQANISTISDPNMIRIGDRLVIP